MAIEWLSRDRKIKLKAITLPEGFAERLKGADAAEMATSQETFDTIHLPSVREIHKHRGRQYILCAGGDRVAAYVLRGIKQHKFQVFRCSTDEEFLALREEENLRRRAPGAESKKIAAAVAARAEQIERNELPDGTSEKEEPPRKPGRPKTAKGKAREAIAATTGRSPEAIRKHEERAKAKDAPKPQAGDTTFFEGDRDERATPKPLPPPVDTWDLDVSPSVVANDFPAVRVVQSALDEIERMLKAAKKIAKGLEDGGALAKATHAQIIEGLNTAAECVAYASPDVACLYCKLRPALRAKCDACRSRGFASKEQIAHVDPRLKDRGKDAKVPDGRGGFVLVSDLSPDGDDDCAF